ncbi:MAG TPA: glucokinase [Rhodanobacteraceae bacterium]|nr:glucokinase [Rhodanobacteraceae bacterium]
MEQPGLIGDIGGTNARFALTDLSAPSPEILHERTFGDGEFASLQDAALHYLSDVAVKPKRAALAVASPIHGDEVVFTNRAWSFSRGAVQRALALDELQVINDFGAIAWAAPQLDASVRVVMHGQLAASLQPPITLIGPGTGLGVALLVGPRAQGWRVVETEGGHASFAPQDKEEHQVARWIAARCGRVSNERLLSGDGLSHIDAALRGVVPAALSAPQPGTRTAKEIVAAALQDNDADAKRALDLFCRVFGGVAGDAALLHGARTVMIAGGVVLHFLDYFLASEFMRRFSDKGRYRDYMQRIAVQVITHANPGLLGAAVALRNSA